MADAINELRRELHKRGYDTRRNQAGHWLVIDPQGEEVRTKKGQPITLPSTPSDHRGINNAISTLRNAGVLPRPSTSTPVRIRKGMVEPEKVNSLRDELTKVMKGYNLRQTDIIHYGDYYHAQHRLDVPGHPQTLLSSFLKGKSLGAAGYSYVERTLAAIKSLDGNIPRAEELRGRTTVHEPLPPDEVGVEVEGEPRPKSQKLPDLAFDAMRLMYANEKDDTAIREVVERIARLELT